ncbi:cation-translocating P-type ATPase [Clostridium arbusti]|uniref:cation-translocating P-type ATPase n=1 Tax=Clostridium arbusti TaxID=1137848 RepID=UPI000287BE45|nr:HAD-IC family P-type ATPase [Clostridium arbusti]
MNQNSSISVDCKSTRRKEVVLYRRIRIPVRYTYRSKQNAQHIEILLYKKHGIKFVKANPITSKVLILYDEYIINKETIVRLLEILVKELKIQNKNAIKNVSKNYNEEIALAIAPNLSETESNGNMWHSMDIKNIRNILKTNYEKGISNKSANDRLMDFGLNVISENKKKSILQKFFSNLNDTSAKLLVGVGIASFFLGQIADAIAVLGIVFVETSLGVIHQNKAEQSIYSLKNMIVHKATVLRSGKEVEIESKNLVPGDIILLDAGERVPTDARIIQCNYLRVNESSLTGESIAITKNTGICNRQIELANRDNMLYMGTDIVSGNATAVVVETGMNTELGNIATMLQNIKLDQTPLQKRMKNFTQKLTKICIIFCIGVSTVGILFGRSLAEILTLSVSFSVGALPESLPAVVTIAMGLSVQRLANRNAIVRKMNAVETLGYANVICCDKTGTLTLNEMTVKKIYCDKSLYKITGLGYEPKGKMMLLEGEPNKTHCTEELLKAGILCSDAKLVKQENKWQVQGDPTEGALLTAAGKCHIDEEDVKKAFERIREIPFDSCRRYMTVVVKSDNCIRAYCKGAFGAVIGKCSMIYEDGEERLLTKADKERIISIRDDMTGEALRVLTFAYKNLKCEKDDINNNFTFLGLAAMEDSPRLEVKNSIKKCHNAGIKVVMITGDNKGTASTIGKQLGLLNGGLIVSGAELEDMNDEELDSKISNIEVFARTSPEQKLRIVKAFKRFGYVVAMTGDGVNDAPAIKEASIGIAMGNNGSDVAKDAADITLVDDNFSTIVRAIEEGRAVSNNIKNTTKYLLAGSLGEIIAIGACSLVTGMLPLIPIQILWTNVICETILGASLAVEPSSENVMDYPPLEKNSPLIGKELSSKIIKRGIGIGLTSAAVFEGYNILGFGVQKARTMAFSNLILTQLVNVHDCRNNKKIMNNRYMTYATVSSVVLLGAIIYLPFIGSIFGTVPLGIADAGILLASTSCSRI